MNFDYVKTPFGRGVVGVEKGRLAAFRFTATNVTGLGERNPAALKDVKRRLERYFRGERVALGSIQVPGTTPFARRVYEAVRNIPYGEVRTYGEIARTAGSPGAARAVGQLMARNPLVLAIPCHRVVASNGLGGFTGGLHRKKHLLKLESRR